ncbi:MAG: hypothetical protein JSS98_17100, partial [Bacteroidetes bacterium]|nr:hypothetical protein [Bacteroidota bacterium]
YEFQYDTSHFNFYDYRQYDRWGNFKNAADNPGGLNNSEFPYVIQNTALANEYASVAQLNKIILPSGGSISVTYESDDYAYVQNKRASQMCFLNGVGNQGSSSGLINADYIYVNLPNTVSSPQEMISRYFEGVDKLYFKCLLDLDGKGHKEYVPGYAKISGTPELIGNNIARIKLDKVNGTNPIAKSGWQFLRMNLPKYAYPGSNNLESNQSDIVKAIRALLAALGSIKEFIYGYEKRAKNKGYSNKIDLSKSWVRLCSPTKKKLGGGSRVKRIDISDDWVAMSGTAGAKTSTYSQLYDYTTKDDNGDIISSGVASYEPLIGNDENPFRQPVNYKQGQFLGLDNYYYIEQPFGESFFPAANVGYSKVTVKTIGTGDDESVNRTGTVVSEFFTAKDYPTKLDVLGLQERKPASNKILKLIGGISYEVLGLSQGYSVELNDMHGKPKTVNVYNKSGQNISSVEYFYKTVNELSEKKELTNTVKIIDSTGSVSDGNIGMDVEMFTDMREQTTNNLGVSIKVSGGLGSIFIFPLPFFFPGIGVNYDKRSYRAASTVKVVNRFAIQYKVKKTENGSSITSENLLWDEETGNVLLTKTQNEYDDPVYSFAYPAHWVYSRMGQAYQNLGTIMSNFSTGSDGTISNSTYNSLLVPGDELIDINSSGKYWVINSPISSISKKRLINQDGAIQTVNGLTVKVLRSGLRNMANTAIATITSLNNPVVGDKLDISQITKILDAKATVFNEEWSMPVKNIFSTTTSTVCNVSTDCMERFIRASMILRFTHGIYLPASFYSSDSTAPYSAWYIISSAYGVDDSSCYSGFLNDSSAESVPFYQYHVGGTGVNLTISNGDSAQLGNCKMHFDYVDTEFLHLTHYYISVDSIIDGVSPCFGSVRVITDANIPCGFDVVRDSTAYCAKDTILKFHLDCSKSSGAGTCIDPVGKVFNPYYAGILGNWRADSQFVYQVARENLVTDPAKFGSTDIRKSGAYSLFNPFWKYNTTTKIWEKNPSADKKWIAANHVTYFNDKGIEIENKDALNRYSSALFGYLESLPVAVASNSRYREIAYDGFEDYGFNLDCSTQDTCNKNGHFDFHKLLNGSTVDTTSLYAHSGKYSLKVSSSVTINKTVYDSTIASANPVEFDNSGRYLLNGNELVKGFSPIPGKKYILSFWVKDGSPRDATTSVQATINGTNLISNLVSWPVVEGWKRVEQQFTLSSSATSFTLQLNSGGGTVYFDDIRIHPFDGQMKTFAYDPSSQRLMAELDENNFATFYEYDDEGILIRVKKETERGIMTIKETRSSYRKRQ